MTTGRPLMAPAGFVPVEALAFGDGGGLSLPVTMASPLPVVTLVTAAPVAPLSGSTAAAVTAGPFAPQLARPVVVTLSGVWSGTVRVLRSVDGGATLLPLTVGGRAWASFTANINEPVWTESEAAATLWLEIAPTSGTVGWRIAQ